MPACNFTRISKHSAYLLWHIDEPEGRLIGDSTADILAQFAHKKLTHPRRRREWLAARLALQQLLQKLGHTYTTFQKDHWGRLYLVDSPVHLSIAHCSSFALAAVDEQGPIGIDIQLPCEKLQNVKDKFLEEEELKDSNNDLEKLCIYWCAKEAIYKAHGGKSLSFKQDIRIHRFTKSPQGTLWARVGTKRFIVQYRFYDRHVLAWSNET